MLTLTVYTTGPACGKCAMTKNMLRGKGIPFVEVDLRENDAAREYVVEELGYSTAPVVVVDDHDHWSDLRPDEIERVAAAIARQAEGASQ